MAGWVLNNELENMPGKSTEILSHTIRSPGLELNTGFSEKEAG
jgi:hypothetical protein